MNYSTETSLITDSEASTENTLSPSFRIIASSIYVILLILSLFMTLLQLASYIKERKVFKTMAFFIISSQMLICNLMVIISMIIFMITAAISDKLILPEKVYKVLTFFECLAYNGLLLFAFLLTLNRFMVFGFKKTGAFVFDGPRIYIIIIIFWLLTLGIVIALMLSPCPVVPKPEDLGFGFECIDGKANIFNYISQYMSTYLPIIMIIQYILIYAEIKIGIFCNSFCCALNNLLPKNQTKKAQNRAEMKLLLQAAMICSTFLIQNFCWTYLPFITSNFEFGKELIIFAVMIGNVLLYSVNAIVVLIFNGMVRRTAISFFKKGAVSKNSLAAKTVTLF